MKLIEHFAVPMQKDLFQHILEWKLSKVSTKERILKAVREKKKVSYKRIPIRLQADFSAETVQARREQNNILKVLKDKSS